MKSILIVVCLALGVTAKSPFSFDYHEEIGIPEAARVKRAEEAQDFDGARIVGGQASSLGAHPHAAGLSIALLDGRSSMCGCSILTYKIVVTAAHCWRSRSLQALLFTVILGTTNFNTGGVRLGTTNVQMHANYNSSSLQNDIAIAVTPPINFNNNIQPIAIATGNNNYVGTWATAVGYGRISDSIFDNNRSLRQATLQVITNDACHRVYGPEFIFSSTLCTSTTNGQSTCGGDSGGPLTIGSGSNFVLIGISSFVSGLGCTHRQPAGFARVTSFASWINARI